MDRKTGEQNIRNMLNKDAFSRWLGIEIVSCEIGNVKLQMKIKEEMTNGYGIAHGGILFALADTAMAFAAGTHGNTAPALTNNISFLKTAKTGDLLTAESEEIHHGRKSGVYNITIRNENSDIIAVMWGTVFVM